jgi:hypothetical protein
MYTMDELKQDAALAAANIEINWEKLADPAEAQVLVEKLDLGIKMLPDLESIYTKLTSGKSVLAPEEDTPLGYDDIEKYTALVAEELYAAYVLAAIKETYEQVNTIIALSGSR